MFLEVLPTPISGDVFGVLGEMHFVIQSEYLIGIVLSSLSTSVMAVLFGTFVASILFGLSLPPLVLPFVALSIILALFAITLGILSAAIVLRLGPSAEWFAWPIPAILQPLVGVFYPISVLPAWAQYIARLMPPSYVFQELRNILAGVPLEWGQIGIAFSLSLVYLAIVSWVFVRTCNWALQTGAISRFGSETF